MAEICDFTYAFAKEKGLVVLRGEDRLTLGVREGADARSLIEARRALGVSFELKPLSLQEFEKELSNCLLYTSPSPRDATLSRMPSSA